MTLRISSIAALSLLALSACDGPAPGVDGGLDAPATDTPVPPDAPTTDVPGTDAPRTDVPADTSVSDSPDAPIDVTEAVNGALDWICGVPAYAECTAPWSCECDTRGGPPPDVDECVAGVRSDCERGFRSDLEADFRSGAVTFDEEALAACVAAARRSFDLCLADPAIDGSLPGACLDAFVLTTGLGSVCRFDGMRCASGAGLCDRGLCVALEATAGASCERTCASGLRCVDGACADPVEAGGACSDHEDCAGEELCIGGTCEAPAAEGEGCSGSVRCGFGMRCVRSMCVVFTDTDCAVGSAFDCGAERTCERSHEQRCNVLRTLGETCFGDKECEPTLACDRGTETCVALPREGEECSSRCADGLTCIEQRGVSSCRRPGRLAESCLDLFGISGPVCDVGLACRSGSCEVAPRIGEPCSDDQICEPGLACFFDTNTCQPPGTEGDECESSGICTDGLFCNYDRRPAVCAPLLADGEECTSGFCARDLDCRYFEALSRSICVVPGAVGEPCTSVCEAGAYCGEDPEAGACTATICSRLGGGRPEPEID